MIPNKLQLKVYAPALDAGLVSKVVPIFHRWITERALDEILVDVADYRHVFQGPGLTLIGHESTYHIDEANDRAPRNGALHGVYASAANSAESKSQYGLVCFRKRGFDNVNAPLLDALWRVLTACELLERELSLVDELFDAGSLKVSIASRAALTPLFQLSEFARFVSTRLAPLYGGAPRVELVDGGLPSLRVHSDKRHPVSSVRANLRGLLHPNGIA